MSKRKLSQPFFLNYPMRRQVVRNVNGKITKELELIGVLFIEGVCYCDTSVPKTDPNQRLDYDLESVMYDGVNVLHLLEHFDNLDSLHGIILKHISAKFNEVSHPDEDGEVGRIAPAVNGCNDRVGVLKIFEPLNKILSTFKTN